MPSHRRSKKENSTSEESFFDTYLWLDGYSEEEFDSDDLEAAPRVRVRFDADTAKIASQIMQGLRTSRGIMPAANVSNMHPLVQKYMRSVQEYYNRMRSDESEDDTPQGGVVIPMDSMTIKRPTVKQAVAAVQQAMETWEREAMEDALQTAMLIDNFETRIVRGGQVIKFTNNIPFSGIDDDVWGEHDDAFAEGIVNTGTVPFWVPDPKNPAEVRCQLALALMDENPIMHRVHLTALFAQAMLHVAQVYYGDELDQEELDSIGFRVGGLDTGVDKRPSRKPSGKDGKRTKGTAKRSVSPDAGDSE